MELLDSARTDNTHDHELEGVDFHNPIRAMGAQAAKEEVVQPEKTDPSGEDDNEVPYWGD